MIIPDVVPIPTDSEFPLLARSLSVELSQKIAAEKDGAQIYQSLARTFDLTLSFGSLIQMEYADEREVTISDSLEASSSPECCDISEMELFLLPANLESVYAEPLLYPNIANCYC